MNKPIQNGGPSSWGLRYPLVVQNAGSEPAPGYAVVQVVNSSSASESAMYLVQKPNGDPNAQYVLLSPQGLGDTPGGATNEYPALALITGSPAINQEIGPVNGSWMLTTSGKGFVYRGGLAGGIGRVTAKASVQAGDDFPLVRIVNNTGLPLPFGSIVGYGASVDPPPGTLYRIPTFEATSPTPGRPFCVLLNDVAAGGIVDAGPVGIVPCQINLSDATHEYAEAIGGDYTKLASATSGQARIIWREKQAISGGATLGLQWARVRLDPVSAIEDPWGVVYQRLTAATGARDGPITPGHGLVRLYLPPTSGPIGTPWQPGPPVPCETSMYAESAAYKIVIIRKSRIAADGSTIYRAISQGCQEQPSG